MSCPLCRRRPAKRACPALAQTICPTCCATKRLVEIRCPADCVYLAGALRHPAAVVRKQQEQDLTVLIGSMGQRLSEVQLRLFFLLGSVVVRYRLWKMGTPAHVVLWWDPRTHRVRVEPVGMFGRPQSPIATFARGQE